MIMLSVRWLADACAIPASARVKATILRIPVLLLWRRDNERLAAPLFLSNDDAVNRKILGTADGLDRVSADFRA
jgi:hypothetical protein